MRSGSTVLGMAASSTGTDSESSIAGSISSAVSSDALGIPILSSSVGVFLDDAPYTDPSSTTSSNGVDIGMIVGVVVGSVAALVITGIAVYKYKKSREIFDIKPETDH
jgi:hypothetical protein